MIRFNHRRHSLPTLLAVLALGAAAFLPSTAHSAPPPAQPPLINDAMGDTGYICTESPFGVPTRCGREVPAQHAPAIDITQGDISFESTALVFETTVVDLDDPGAQEDALAQYAMTAVSGNVRIRMNASRSMRQEPPFATVTVENTSNGQAVTGPVGNTFDDAGNTVEWRIGLADLNESIAHVCPTCGDLRRGNTLSDIWAETQFHEPARVLTVRDTAFANRPYTIGDD